MFEGLYHKVGNFDTKQNEKSEVHPTFPVSLANSFLKVYFANKVVFLVIVQENTPKTDTVRSFSSRETR